METIAISVYDKEATKKVTFTVCPLEAAWLFHTAAEISHILPTKGAGFSSQPQTGPPEDPGPGLPRALAGHAVLSEVHDG